MRARWPLAVLCLSCATCRSCGCVEGEKTYEHIDEPIKVELVRDTKWVGGKIPGPMSSFFIRVHANPTFDEPTACTRAELAENDVGTLVAFRCKDGRPSPWTLIRLGHSGRHFRDCLPLLGENDEPSFAEVRPLSFAAPRIVGCALEETGAASQTFEELYERLVQELRETEGNAAVVQFLVEASSANTSGSGDPWLGQVQALPAGDRAAVVRQLCPALREVESSSNRYSHAAMLCPLEDPPIGDTALDRVRKGFAAPGDASDPYADGSFGVAATIAMRMRAADTGLASCGYVGAHPIDDLRLTAAYTAIAWAKTPCPAVAVKSLCEDALDCDGGLCSDETLRPETRQWPDQAGALDAGARSFTVPMSGRRALLAAALVQGPLPIEVTLPNARRHYAIDLGTGPACWTRAEAGVTCECSNNPSTYDICNAPLDGGRLTSQSCSFSVDDKKRTIGDSRHACGPAGATCITDTDCCIETACRAADGGIGPSHCIP